MTYLSRVPVGPFSISIQPMGPGGLRVTCTMCAIGVQFLKKGLIPRSRTWDLDQGLERLYHCARRLAMLTSLWSRYSILLAMLQVDLNWIYPCKWKQICARWTCGNGGGSPIYYGGSGVLLVVWRGSPGGVW
jgi:hypothetical protein